MPRAKKTTTDVDLSNADTESLKRELEKRAHIEALEQARGQALKESEKEKKAKATMAIIAEKIRQAHALIAECEKLSEESGQSFAFSVEYGMGGQYHPKSAHAQDVYGDDQSGWVSSSQNC